VSETPPKPEPSERVPKNGAKAALLTAKGIIGAVIASWSVNGAVLEVCDGAAAGARVRLRVQEQDKIWEKKATVLWVKEQSLALEFETDGPTRKVGFSALPRLRQFLYSLRAPTAAAPQHETTLRAKHFEIQLPGRDNQDRRRHRRLRFDTGARVKWSNSPLEANEARIADASKSGVLFTTNRAYPIGTKLQVQYPYPNSTAPERQGTVVRVDLLPDGRQRVAVAFG
jgi:hypothetical protein